MTTIHLALPERASARIRYGAELLRQAVAGQGLVPAETATAWTVENYRDTPGSKIAIAVRGECSFIQALEEAEVLLYHTDPPVEEAFYLASLPGSLTVVVGGSATGVLYGCQQLAGILAARGELPDNLAMKDGPVMKLRGPVVPLQLTKVEPPRRTYEYPITPGRFPWFYDRGLWSAFLDMLLEQRCNVIYVWSGHPFSSLVKLDEYPEAMEVTEEEFRLNVETFQWLAEACDRRGIWLVLKFYNIHIPLPFAEKHGLDLHQPKPLPLTSDYYIRSISAFIRNFPHVGLMVCLGEALQGAIYGAEWFNETILAGVHDGLKDRGVKELPPIIVRAHAIPSEKVMAEAIPNYANLFTEAKYNGESLTTYTPRGKWQHTHRHLASLGSIHLFNVHILANLEPFRYGSPSFIQKSVQAAKYRLHTNGIHLYPLFYWDWPYAPDKTEPRLRQMDRDWIWFAAWFRYAWNPDRDPSLEREYWIAQLAERFGSREAGEAILDSYEHTGEIAPKLLRRFGITEGNRQTMSLGMTMSQLTNPARYGQWKELWDCQAPQGERLDEYVAGQLQCRQPVGESPLDIVASVEGHAERAARAVARAAASVTKAREEYARISSDVRAISLMTKVYTEKVRAAILILTYKEQCAGNYTDQQQVKLLEEAQAHIYSSLEAYRELAEWTADTYLYANSMQTPQRKVPFSNGETYGHWQQCLPLYEAEYSHYARIVEGLKAGRLPEKLAAAEGPPAPYRQAEFILHSPDAETYVLQTDSELFTDGGIPAASVAEELQGLTAIRFNRERSSKEGFDLDIELNEPAIILIGYFNSSHPQWLQVPSLEENTHADDRGGLAPVLTNALKVFFQPSVNVHAFRYEAGRHRLVFGRGAYLVPGVIKADQPLRVRDVEGEGKTNTLDWLYES
ncbi:hypothetical protein [Paenibacillus sp. 1P07SE]|uniref:hypothetical protein n=1 Tax=Paenibacillus sp. 1P07SE TaxID=3132209 RepID=UPI0039A687C8